VLSRLQQRLQRGALRQDQHSQRQHSLWQLPPFLAVVHHLFRSAAASTQGLVARHRIAVVFRESMLPVRA